MKLSAYFAEHPELAAQWVAEQDRLVPEELSASSREKALWRCEKGHIWAAQVTARVHLGRGCPYCAGQRPIPGETDLATLRPEVAALWDADKNFPLTPQQVGPSSRRKLWWRCEHGHSWSAPAFSLSNSGCRCPVCAGKKVLAGENDLATLKPHLIKEWCAELNGPLTPQSVSLGQEKKVWWQCPLGHRYQAYLFSRTNEKGTGCPYCAGKKVLAGFNDLATLAPWLVPQWHAELNGELTPQMVTRGSHRQVWWQCGEGHVWKAAVFSRTRAKPAGCPVCAGTIRRNQPRQELFQRPQTPVSRDDPGLNSVHL